MQYEGAIHRSWFERMEDGTDLAISLYRPVTAQAGDPLPTVLMFSPYRGLFNLPRFSATLFGSGGLVRLTDCGYNVVVADVRGTGASFGVRHGPFSEREIRDCTELLGKLAQAAWSDGAFGLWGCSQAGNLALYVAAEEPHGLKAVMTGTSVGDQYDTMVQGGIPSRFFRRIEAEIPPELDLGAPPVDGDDGSLLRRAYQEHRGNMPWLEFFQALPYRDSRSPRDGRAYWHEVDLLERFRKGAGISVALYHYCSSDDFFGARGMFSTHAEYAGPQELVYGGRWGHCSMKGLDIHQERRRFFDLWLKGRGDVPAESERVRVCVTAAGGAETWRNLPSWPPAQGRSLELPLIAGGDPNPGMALAEIVDEPPASDARFYRSAPLVADVTILGAPVLRLMIARSSSDLDMFAGVSVIHPGGERVLVSSGRLRASHRETATRGHGDRRLPWRASQKQDVREPAPGTAFLMEFDLHPIAHHLECGAQIELELRCGRAIVKDVLVDCELADLLPEPASWEVDPAGSRLDLLVLPGPSLSTAAADQPEVAMGVQDANVLEPG